MARRATKTPKINPEERRTETGKALAKIATTVYADAKKQASAGDRAKLYAAATQVLRTALLADRAKADGDIIEDREEMADDDALSGRLEGRRADA